MASSDIKGFYRQRKSSNLGVTKPKSSSKKKPTTLRGRGTASLAGPNLPQPPAVISHGGAADLDEEYGKEDEGMRKFDMDMRYGPCLGMTRLERWDRAVRMSLNPPSKVGNLLMAIKSGDSGLECLWEGKI